VHEHKVTNACSLRDIDQIRRPETAKRSETNRSPGLRFCLTCFSGVVAEITDWRNAGSLIGPDNVRFRRAGSPSRPLHGLHSRFPRGGSGIRPYQQTSSHICLAKHTQAVRPENQRPRKCDLKGRHTCTSASSHK
jgi:hypothetical protein